MTDNDSPTIPKPRTRATKPPAPTVPASATLAPSVAASAGPTKSATVIKLLLRAKGATPMELIAATDWQPHSLRAFLSGLRKKGRVIAREPRKSGEVAYRIVVAVAAAAVESGSSAAGDAAIEDSTAIAGGGNALAGDRLPADVATEA